MIGGDCKFIFFDDLGENIQNMRMCVDKVGKIPDDNRIEVSTKFLGFIDIVIEIVRVGIWRYWWDILLFNVFWWVDVLGLGMALPSCGLDRISGVPIHDLRWIVEICLISGIEEVWVEELYLLNSIHMLKVVHDLGFRVVDLLQIFGVKS